jgi:hypothetical protein
VSPSMTAERIAEIEAVLRDAGYSVVFATNPHDNRTAEALPRGERNALQIHDLRGVGETQPAAAESLLRDLRSRTDAG